MPFITKDRRAIIDLKGPIGLTEIKPGDMCYYYYAPMVRRWKENPCWTTAHDIYRKVMDDTIHAESYIHAERMCAMNLAWQVFFQMYVMPYEIEKKKLNGDI